MTNVPFCEEKREEGKEVSLATYERKKKKRKFY